ncbi:MAG: hypothetical protein AMXMBFR37_09390 [Steroidobacteraceae bacterium]
MPELRVILLLAGLALIAGLWIRERRRAAASGEAGAAASRASPAVADPAPGAAPAPRLPPARVVREAPADLPVIQIESPGELDVSFASAPPDDAAPAGEAFVSTPAPAAAPPGRTIAGAAPARAPLAPPPAAPATPTAPITPATPADEDGDVIGPVTERAADASPWDAPRNVVLSGADLVVDWPPEAERQIVALRVVPRGGERFAGRSLRQALVGEGFLHGPMDIFHLPGDDARVLLSAAGLTRPGVFQLDTMDTGRYAGLNVFAVLPGPLPADETFDRLIEAARALAARLNAELRDQRGEPLTTARVVALRAQLTGAGP